MDIEMLKIVLEVAGAAGTGAVKVAIVYMAMGFIDSLLVFSGMMTVLYAVFKLFRRGMAMDQFGSKLGSRLLSRRVWSGCFEDRRDATKELGRLIDSDNLVKLHGLGG